MPFTVTVFENPASSDSIAEPVERYRQTVDVIDLQALINTINKKPRKPRERKPKAGAQQ